MLRHLRAWSDRFGSRPRSGTDDSVSSAAASPSALASPVRGPTSSSSSRPYAPPLSLMADSSHTSSDEPTAAFILTEQADGTFVLLDAAGRTHRAEDTEALGEICQALLHDPTLPRYETATEQTVQLEEVATKVTAKVFPGFEFAAAPAVQMLRDTLQHWHQRSARPKRRARRSKKTSPQAPQTFAQLAEKARKPNA